LKNESITNARNLPAVHWAGDESTKEEGGYEKPSSFSGFSSFRGEFLCLYTVCCLLYSVFYILGRIMRNEKHIALQTGGLGRLWGREPFPTGFSARRGHRGAG